MFTSTYDPVMQVMIHTGSGDVSMEDVLVATKGWFSHAAFDPEYPVIWDIRDAFLDLTIEDLRRVYALVRDALPTKRTGGKTAWVHTSGLVRAMIDVLADEFDWGSQWRTFMSVEEAVSWCLELE